MFMWRQVMVNIRDRIFYLRLFNKKHVKSHESIMYAGDLEDATKLYQQYQNELPKHVYYEISDYALDNSRIINE